MARRTPIQPQIERDTFALVVAKDYARLLAARHGGEFPGFVSILQRVDEALDAALLASSIEDRAVSRHGRAGKKVK